MCPGWLATRPAVQEGSTAATALEQGALEQLFPDLENPIVEAAMCGVAAWRRFEREAVQLARQRATNG